MQRRSSEEEKKPAISPQAAIAKLEKKLKIQNRCGLSLGVPLIPYRVRSLDFKTHDGRMFSNDVFDELQLLKLIITHRRRRHPVSRAPLDIGDINSEIIFDIKYAKFLNKKLKKFGWTRKKLLAALGISEELHTYLTTHKFKGAGRARLAQVIQANLEGGSRYAGEAILVVLLLSVFTLYGALSISDGFSLSSALEKGLDRIFSSLLSLLYFMPDCPRLIINFLSQFNLINDVLIPLYWFPYNAIGVIGEKAIIVPVTKSVDFLQKYSLLIAGTLSEINYSQLPRSIFAGFANVYSAIPDRTIPSVAIGLTYCTATTAMAVRSYHFGRHPENFFSTSCSTKALIGMLALGILLLGIEAFTDCFGLVGTMTSRTADRVGFILPLAMTLGAMLFGRSARPGPQSRGEIEFDILKNNNFDPVPPRN